MKELIFRSAYHEDIPEIIKLIYEGQIEGENSIQHDDIQAFEKCLDCINQNSNQFLFVVLMDNEIVATFQLYLLFNIAHGLKPDTQVENFFVKSTYRNMGIGGQIIQWIFKFARSKQCRRVQLTTNRKRSEAQSFYVKNGFIASHVGMKILI